MKEDIEKLVVEKYGKGYLKALKFTLSAEGGFANHIKDTGGMTYSGIARKYNSKWSGWEIIDRILEKYPDLIQPYTVKPRSVKFLDLELRTNNELEIFILDFYYENYYKKICGDKIDKVSTDVSSILFDISILSGVNRANKTLQRLLNRYFGGNLLVDGILGNSTLGYLFKIIEEKSEGVVSANLLLEYADNLIEASKIGNNKVFLNGWMNRINNLRNFIRLN